MQQEKLMRSYLIDELNAEDTARLARALQDMGLGAGMEGLFWLPVPLELLSPLQREHLHECGPYVMGLEVEERGVRLELLVRARGRLRCECVHYASFPLREHMQAYLDRLLCDLNVTA